MYYLLIYNDIIIWNYSPDVPTPVLIFIIAFIGGLFNYKIKRKSFLKELFAMFAIIFLYDKAHYLMSAYHDYIFYDILPENDYTTLGYLTRIICASKKDSLADWALVAIAGFWVFRSTKHLTQNKPRKD